MPYGPQDARDLPLTAEEERYLREEISRPEDISAFFHDRRVRHNQEMTDALNPSIIHEIQQPEPTAPSKVSVTVSGMTFSGTQAEVDAQMLAYFRAAEARGQRLQTTNSATPRNADGTFAKQTREGELNAEQAKQLVDRAALDMKFRTGQIPVEQYLRETGAFDNYAREVLGVEPDPARRERAQNERLRRDHGLTVQLSFKRVRVRDWPGGDEMQARLGHIIRSLPD